MNKKMLIIVTPLLVIILAAAGWMFMRPAPAAVGNEAKIPGPVHTMAEPFIANLADSPSTPRFIKVGVALRLSKASAGLVTEGTAQVPATVEGEPQIRDIIISSLQARTSTDLSTDRGRTDLKREIVKKVNKQTDVKILDVYFTEFAVQ
jgi:flagellar FliL protein